MLESIDKESDQETGDSEDSAIECEMPNAGVTFFMTTARNAISSLEAEFNSALGPDMDHVCSKIPGADYTIKD